ncbi:MAG: 4-(cytidine 5'-diphospho)-2-C-methyl-D-erythritol kinase [Acidimicrobiia bacterium]|nr:4-(cytidine 5'-diphospho)-2-C-methyl-D-erythritol kinase [Acidimicrobiia bacterium]MCY4434220.1 4-(cytidine 5'-diphospho)-2-C-methyl-D-erythritol kinase [bacterium]
MVAVTAPAKLTLSLRITGVRPDGYHLIDAEMVSLDLADVLNIEAGEGVVIKDGADIEPADNLITQALALVGRDARVAVTKRIPLGAGLGGGSADAAAILRWAGYSDVQGAAQLGADVPFCLVGGRARVQGIGELVQPLEHTPRILTLLIPPFGCSTPEVYRCWDELGGPEGASGNDLEPAALEVEPRLDEFRRVLEQATGQRARLAGSGSTWFVEGDYPGDGRIVVRTLPAQPH